MSEAVRDGVPNVRATQMPACNGVAPAAKVFRQVLFYLGGRFVRHGVQIRAEFRQQRNPKALDHSRGLDPLLVIPKSALQASTP